MVRFLATVSAVRPLALHFSLQNGGTAPAYVPRLLTPLGAFVSVTIRDAEGALIYQTETPKVKLKLDPSRDASYLELEAGYSYGVLFELDDATLVPGEYQLDIAYSNGQFQGTSGAPVGVLAYRSVLPLHVGST
ncbi:MAG: hypothetical protein QOI05_436 [Bradyrhizobium sp.]|jgi:hypothetical protein|nr:hypothetical protein [Bradyrhizobium sp.]